jgi:glucose/arabinose dehydrogenase
MLPLRHGVRLCVGLMLLLGVAGATPAPVLTAGLSLPPGFAAEPLITGLRSPRAFAFATDGRIFVAERGHASSGDINFATIRVWQDGALLPPSSRHWFNVCGDGERGLLGLALDPQFSANSHLYVYYTRQGSPSTCGYNQGAGGPRNRVSRVTIGADGVQPSSELVLLDNIPADGGVHNAGDLRFDSSGNLYVSTGNANLSANPAQRLDSLGGKILRIKPTAGGYSVPVGNPFAGEAGARRCGTIPPEPGGGPCAEVYAYGLRNPFRITTHPQRGELYAFDVGGGGWEEVNRIEAGGNYGHPAREGPCDGGSACLGSDEFFGPATSPQGAIDPLYAYAHTLFQGSSDAAIIGGAFYTGSGYPAAYEDNLFVADFVRGWVRRLVRDAASGNWSRADFATGADGIVGLQAGPDDNLYLLLLTSEENSQLVRVRYTGAANQAPVARISASPSSGPMHTVFSFSGAASTDPDGDTLLYSWDLGDNTSRETSEPTITHRYSSPGAKVVTLRVSDDGEPPRSSAPAQVTVFPGNSPPTAQIALVNNTEPARGDRFFAGDSWSFHAVGLSDDSTPPADLTLVWKVVFHHRDHTHPFLDELNGREGSLTIPTSGESDPEVWYRVIVRVTDGAGQTTEVARDLYPALASVAFDTVPPGGQLWVDGQSATAPIQVTRVVGLEVTVEAPDERSAGGQTHRFWRWTHSTPRAFTLRVPEAGGSYTALYRLTTLGERRMALPLLRH